MGKKGFKTPKKHPLVPNLAHSAISKTLKGNISFQQSDLKEIAVVSFFPSFSFEDLLQKENQAFSLGIPGYRP